MDDAQRNQWKWDKRRVLTTLTFNACPRRYFLWTCCLNLCANQIFIDRYPELISVMLMYRAYIVRGAILSRHRWKCPTAFGLGAHVVFCIATLHLLNGYALMFQCRRFVKFTDWIRNCAMFSSHASYLVPCRSARYVMHSTRDAVGSGGGTKTTEWMSRIYAFSQKVVGIGDVGTGWMTDSLSSRCREWFKREIVTESRAWNDIAHRWVIILHNILSTSFALHTHTHTHVVWFGPTFT